MKQVGRLAEYVIMMRKRFKLSQLEAAGMAGVGLRFFRELEAGKKTLRIDKVNQVLSLFGAELVPGPIDRSKWDQDATGPPLPHG